MTLGITSGIPRPKRGGRKLGRKAAVAAGLVKNRRSLPLIVDIDRPPSSDKRHNRC